MRCRAPVLRMLALLGLAAAWAAPAHAQWRDLATISSTMGNNAGYVCTGAGRTDLGCALTAPFVTASGALGIGTTTPSSTLHVNGTARFENVVNFTSAAQITAVSTSSIAINSNRHIYLMSPVNGGTFIGVNTLTPSNIVPPSTTLHVSGTIRIANSGENCDANRLGAIRYAAGSVDICRNITNGWEPLATTGANSAIDRITSNSMAGVTANDTGYISLTTGGVTGTVYFTPSGNLVNSGISTTGTISGTSGYLGNLRLGQTGAFTNAISPFQSYGDIVGDYAGIGGLELRNINGGPNADFRFVISDDRGSNGSTLNFSMSSSNNTNTLFGQPRNQLATLFVNGSTDANARALAIGTLKAHPLIFGTNNNEAMRIISTGFVGIGGNTPNLPLDVSGSTRIRGALYLGSTTPTSRIYGVDTATYISMHWGSPDITFNTNGLRRMTVASTNLGGEYGGRVGIGSMTYPSTTLDVSGSVKLRAEPSGNAGETCDTNRLGAIRYTAGSFDVCRNTTNGWEPLATATSATDIAINTGLSGSLVFRDELGKLKARNDLSVSSTTGSVGIGAGAPASLGNNSLYAAGNIRAVATVYGGVFTTNGVTGGYYWAGNNVGIVGNSDALQNYMSFTTSSTEAMRIVSSGYVGVGISNPLAPLHVSGSILTSYNQSRLTLRPWESGSDQGVDINTGGTGFTKYSMQLMANSRRQVVITTSGTIIGNNLPTNNTAYTPLDINGTLRIANSGESCDTNRLGALRYGSGSFDICRNITNGWEPLAISGVSSTQDRITSGTTQMITYNNASATIATNGVERVVVGTNGNVGIGTNTPSTTLHVVGLTTLSSNTAIAAQIDVATPLNIGGQMSDPSLSRSIRIQDATGNLAGYIGSTGETSTANKLVLFGNRGTGGIQLRTSNAYTMNLLPNGLVGISTTDPSTSLHVMGAVRLGNEASTTLQACDINRLGALRYSSGSFDICRNTTNGWEPIATSTSATDISINTGLSGSIVFRDELGKLKAYNTFAISSTNGAVGIGAGAPSYAASNSLFALGNIYGNNLYAGSGGKNLYWGDGSVWIHGNDTSDHLAFVVSATEALRIVSNGYVGIGTAAPAAMLDISGTSTSLLRLGNSTNSFTIRNNGAAIDFAAPSGLVISSNSGTGIQLQGGTASIQFNTQGSGTIHAGSSSTKVMVGGGTGYPSTTLHVSGTLRISNGGESCDTSRIGSIRYTSGSFSVCADTSNGWEPLATTGGSSSADRITSGTTGMYTYNNTSATIATNGVERIVVGTNGAVGIAQQPASGVALSISGSTSVTGRLGVLTASGSNVMIGNLAGSNATGSENTGVGQGAFQNSSGDEGVAIGRYTGQWNTGNETTFIGQGSGLANTGNSVVGIGYNALQNNSASTVVAVGVNAGQENRPAGANASLFGNNSGQFNSGAFAAAVGMSAAQRNSGSNLSAIGGYSAQFNSGADVVAIGYNAAQFNSGTGLVAVGQLAGNKNTATQVTAIGYNAVSAVSNTFTNITGLGYDAQPTKSNQVMLGNTLTEEVATSGAGVFGLHVRVGSATTALMTSATIVGPGAIMYDSTLNALRYSNGTQWNTVGTGSASGDRIVSGTTGMYTYNNTSATIATAGVERLIVATNGNIGIAQQPENNVALAVSGTIKFNNGVVAIQNTNSTSGFGLIQGVPGNDALGSDYERFQIRTPSTSQVTYLENSYSGTGQPRAIAFRVSNIEAIRIATSGAIGIGTPTPIAQLHVSNTGASNILLNSFVSGISRTLALRVDGANSYINNMNGFVGNGSSNNGVFYITGQEGISFNYGNAGSAGSIAMRITSTGLVGIGTTTPSSTLQVSGTVRATQYCDINGTNCTSSPGSASGDRIISGTTGMYTYSNTSATIATAGVERIVIGTTGNVGIGVQPVSGFTLGVSGSLYARGRFDLANNGQAVHIGTNAGSSANTDGVVIGYGAGSNSNVNQVSLIGWLAGEYNEGTNVTGVGRQAAQYNKGDGVLAFGDGAAQGNQGDAVFAIGDEAAHSNTANTVVAFGSGAARNNSGTSVIAVGNFAAQNNGGANVTALGHSAVNSNMFFNVTGLGYNAQPTANNQVMLGDTNTTAVSTSGIYYGRGLYVSGLVSATSITINGQPIGASGASTYASLTDVVYKPGDLNLSGPSGLSSPNANVMNSTAFGVHSLSDNTLSGADNTAFGTETLTKTTTGSLNTSVGSYSLNENLTGAGNTAVGASTMTQSTAGNSNAAFGSIALGTMSSGSNNTAIGSSALRNGATLNNVVAIGYYAGAGTGATSTTNSVFIGANAGRAITTGNSNTLIGYNTGAGITTGHNNLVIGTNLSPFSNTGSNQLNIANAIFGDYGRTLAARIGINVTSPTTQLEVSGTISATQILVNGVAVSSGASDRIISGTTGMYTNNNTSASIVTAGVQRMVIGTTGNVGIGQQPSTNTLEVSGTFKTTRSGEGILWTGRSDSLVDIAQDTSSTLRTMSIHPSVSATDVLQVYANIGGTYYRALTVANGARAVGINASFPSTTLHVAGTLRLGNGGEDCDTNRIGALRYTGGSFSVCANTTNGWEPLVTTGGSSASDRIVSGTLAQVIAQTAGTVQISSTGLFLNYGGSNDTRVELGGGATGNRTSYIDFVGDTTYTDYGLRLWRTNSGPNADSQIRHRGTGNLQLNVEDAGIMTIYTSGTERLRVTSAGNVGIGVSDTLGYKLYVAGNAYSTGTWGASDARFKENIHGMTGLLANVTKLRPVTFTWNDKAPVKDDKSEQIGLIAQEVEKVYPDLVRTHTDGYKAVAYDKLSVLLLGAVKELKSENETLKAQNDAILKRLEALEAKTR